MTYPTPRAGNIGANPREWEIEPLDAPADQPIVEPAGPVVEPATPAPELEPVPA